MSEERKDHYIPDFAVVVVHNWCCVVLLRLYISDKGFSFPFVYTYLECRLPYKTGRVGYT